MASPIPAASRAVFIPLEEQAPEDLAFMRLALDQVRRLPAVGSPARST